jgi:stress response protein SCP2
LSLVGCSKEEKTVLDDILSQVEEIPKEGFKTSEIVLEFKYDINSTISNMDIFAFLLNEDGKAVGVEKVVYFGNLSSNGVSLSGDDKETHKNEILTIDGFRASADIKNIKIFAAVDVENTDGLKENYKGVSDMEALIYNKSNKYFKVSCKDFSENDFTVGLLDVYFNAYGEWVVKPMECDTTKDINWYINEYWETDNSIIEEVIEEEVKIENPQQYTEIINGQEYFYDENKAEVVE